MITSAAARFENPLHQAARREHLGFAQSAGQEHEPHAERHEGEEERVAPGHPLAMGRDVPAANPLPAESRGDQDGGAEDPERKVARKAPRGPAGDAQPEHSEDRRRSHVAAAEDAMQPSPRGRKLSEGIAEQRELAALAGWLAAGAPSQPPREPRLRRGTAD